MTTTTPTAFSGVDFDLAIGAVHGLRAWRLDKLGRLRALHLPNAPAWRPGVNVAECRRGEDGIGGWFNSSSLTLSLSSLYGISAPAAKEPEKKPKEPEKHAVPDEGCKCGFYAYTDPDHEENKADKENKYVVGVIKGTGRTLIGTRGFRCEKAEIVALLDPTRGLVMLSKWRRDQRAKLRSIYPDVPLLATRRDLLAHAPIEAAPIGPDSDEFWRLP